MSQTYTPIYHGSGLAQRSQQQRAWIVTRSATSWALRRIPHTHQRAPAHAYAAPSILPKKCGRAEAPSAVSRSSDAFDSLDKTGNLKDQTTPVSESVGNASFSQAVCNLLNILVGVGILSLPYALREAGWLSLLAVPLIAAVTNYTGKALVECSATVAKINKTSAADVGYSDIAEAAFGSAGKAFVSTTVYAELFGVCSLFFIIMGDNLNHLLAATYGHSAMFYMMVAAAVMIPTVWLPDLKALSYLGFAGVSATAAVVGTILWTYTTGAFSPGAPTQLLNISKLPASLGMFTFCFSGHGIFPTVKSSMKNPERFPQALNISFILTYIICTTVAGLGYLMYGAGVKDIVTFNLPQGMLSLIVSCLILVSPWAKFALTLEPVALAVDSSTEGVAAGTPIRAKRLAVRTGLALSMLAAARFCPFLSLLMALIGSFLTVNVSLIFPAVLHLKLHKGKLSGSRQLVNYVVVALGAFAMVSGTWTSIASIVKA